MAGSPHLTMSQRILQVSLLLEVAEGPVKTSGEPGIPAGAKNCHRGR